MQTEMARPLKIWLLTDVFPPHSGGSGWSTYYLGKALKERGHEVRVLRPIYGEAPGGRMGRVVEYGGLLVEEMLIPQPPAWSVRGGLGKAWSEREARRLLSRRATRPALWGDADVLHGQHSVSAAAASIAAQRARAAGARVVSVGTVRDYWHLCPVSTRLFQGRDGEPFECKECHRLRSYLRCTHTENGPRGWVRVPLSVARWLQAWEAGRTLSKCDAVIAVSRYVRDELARSGRVPADKLYTIPNLVDLPSVERALGGRWPLHDISPGEPFLLFVGKWDTNKGPQMLPDAVAQSGVRMPVVLAGEGPLRAQLEREAKRRGLDFRFVSWVDNEAAILLMRHATALLFPSAWQEPLSRVLLEGLAAGVAIVALDTGGTSDAIVHAESGWLAKDAAEFAEGIKVVSGNTQLNATLRVGARRRAGEVFVAPNVSAQVEALYTRLLEGLGA